MIFVYIFFCQYSNEDSKLAIVFLINQFLVFQTKRLWSTVPVGQSACVCLSVCLFFDRSKDNFLLTTSKIDDVAVYTSLFNLGQLRATTAYSLREKLTTPESNRQTLQSTRSALPSGVGISDRRGLELRAEAFQRFRHRRESNAFVGAHKVERFIRHQPGNPPKGK